MKKIVWLLLLVITVVLVFAACGEKAPASASIETTVSTSAVITANSSTEDGSLVPMPPVSEPADMTSIPIATTSPATSTKAPATTAPDTDAPTPEKTYQNTKWDGETLKVLAIGNSFSDDSMEYLFKIAHAEGVKTIILGNLYIGGCSLQTHLSNAKNNSPAYEYRKNVNNRWVTTNNTTMLQGILDEDWDIITMQQVSGHSGLPSTYRYLDDLVSYVNENKTNKDCQLAWNMTWAYQGDSTHGDFPNYNSNQQTMYTHICNTVFSRILSRDDIAILLSPGTAIQNMRTSFVGDTLTRDGYHLSYELGRYIAGYTWFRILTGKPLDDLKYAPINIIPNDTYKGAVLEAVNAAATKPLEVTPSTFTEKPEGETVDLSGYTELSFSYTVGGFWQSDSNDNYNKIVTGASNSPQFIATELFNKDTLPIGSIIVIDEGFQYRPERWTGNSVQSNRPGQTTSEYFLVTDEFWDGYSYRAFNISVKNTARNITENDVKHFRIYLPNGTVIPDIDVKFESTTSPDPEIDLDKYTKLDFTYTMGAYWNSTDASRHHEIIANADNSGYFIATQTFTKETLPIGSVIVIDEGWQYRPEAWKDDTQQPGSTRPANVTEYIVEVTEEWWGDYVLRAFNIAVKGNNVGIKNNPDAITHFNIYIPKA